MLNIMMNAEGLALGEKLREFKQQSKDLSPPLRGNMITNSSWIRVAHNSFARYEPAMSRGRHHPESLLILNRRLDLLNAALSLHNEVEDKKKKRAKSTANRKSKKKPTTDATYHFIAFVPVGQSVWQLDGLESNPVRLGNSSPSNFGFVLKY